MLENQKRYMKMKYPVWSIVYWEMCLLLHFMSPIPLCYSEISQNGSSQLEIDSQALQANEGNAGVHMLRAPSAIHDARRCRQELGMGSGEIPSTSITVSDSLDPPSQWGKENARLVWRGKEVAWGAPANGMQWVQVDLGKVMYVSGVVTKGVALYRSQWSGFYWVSEYRVEYKMHATDPVFMKVTDGQWGETKNFEGNENGSNEVKNMFYKPIQMQIVRLVVTDWPRNKNMIAMRMELLGCNIENAGMSGCGGIHTLTNPAGFISSMGYPLNYKNNANCQWNIIAPSGQVVMLNFENEISIEEVNNCMMEYVEVIDVVDGKERSLAKLCGTRKPGQYSSTDNILKVRFMTDHYETDKGFRANYQFVNSSGCGGPQLLLDETGFFDSHNHATNTKVQCSWELLAGEGKLVQFHFTETNSTYKTTTTYHADADNCSLGLVQIIEGTDDNNGATTFCGDLPTKPYISAGNRVKVVFSRRSPSHGREFRVHYQSVAASGCGGRRDLKGPSGVFTTYRYPQRYLKNMRCQWNISSHENQTIELNFEAFDLEGDRECNYDFVCIYAGPSERDFLGKYCGARNLTSPFISNSGMLRIIFVSDKVNENTGFKATYTVRNSGSFPTPDSKVRSKEMHTTTSKEFEYTPTAKQRNEVTATTVNTATTNTKDRVSPSSANFPKSVTVTTPKKSSTTLLLSRHPGTVTEEMVKWIIVGLASVSGLLILLVLLGIILCCRQHLARVMELNNSANNNHSSILQNYAYDFSIGSTNHSIRSRQVEQPESSQISECVSRQGTLRRCTSKDSHIYFSIEECCKKRGKDVNDDGSGTEKHHGMQKVHFHAKCQHSSDSNKTRNNSGDGSATFVSEDDIEDEYYEEELEATSGSNSDEIECQARPETNTASCMALEGKERSQMPNNGDGQRKLVDNILYISTDKVA